MSETGLTGNLKEAAGTGMAAESMGNEYASKLETIRSSFEGAGDKAKTAKPASPGGEEGHSNEGEEGPGVEIDIDEGIYGNRGFDKFIDEERWVEGRDGDGENESNEEEQEEESSETSMIEALEKTRKGSNDAIFEPAPVRHPARA